MPKILYLIEEDKLNNRHRYVKGDEEEVDKELDWAAGPLATPEFLKVFDGVIFRPQRGGCQSTYFDSVLKIWGKFESYGKIQPPEWREGLPK